MAGTGTVAVTPEQLRTQAKVYTDAREGIDAAIQKVNRMNGEIANQWKGQAFTAYLEQYNQLETHVKKFKDLLTDINKQLTTYANTVAERDATDAKSFGLS